MSYIGDTINTSATIAERAGADITTGACYAVKYNSNGDVVPCSTSGEVALGLLLAQTPDKVTAGDIVTVQVKDIGLWISGGAFSKGALLASDSKGRATTAGTNGYIMGMALESSDAVGQLVKVQIIKSGYKI